MRCRLAGKWPSVLRLGIEDARGQLVHGAVGLWTVVVAGLAIVGADLMWAVTLGDTLLAGRGLPDGSDVSALARADWINPLALGQVVLAAINRAGPSALVVLQVFVVHIVLRATAAEGSRLGGGSTTVAATVSAATVGAASALVVARLPVWSLLLFPILIALLRREHEEPSRRIWWLVGLIGVWANLHGGALIGAAALAVYLGFSRLRLRPVETGAVSLVTLLMLCATPSMGSTIRYYVDVFNNVAAQRHTGLWARPDFSNALDLAMVVCACILVLLALLRRPPLWEVVLIGGLVVGTAMAARNGVFLLLVCAPAACRRAGRVRAVRERPRGAIKATLLTLMAALAVVHIRGDDAHPPGLTEAHEIQTLVGARLTLAPEPVVETLGQQGVRVWAANPIDAFSHDVQTAYLDFLQDGRVDRGVMSQVQALVAAEGTPQTDAAEDLGLHHVGQIGELVVYLR